MITVPTSKPASLKSNQIDFGTTAAQAIWRDIIRAVNWYNLSLPVGIVMQWYQSQQYAISAEHPSGSTSLPFPHLGWAFLNGAALNAPLSPLHNVVLPDLRNRFLRGSATPGQVGGSATIDLRHSHSVGFTGVTDSPRLDNGGERGAPVTHNHAVGVDLPVITNLPLYADLQYYVKVNGGCTRYADLSAACIDDALFTRFGNILSVELAQSIKSLLDYLNSTMIVGSIWPILTNIPGVTVNSDIFQECTGAAITHPTSPLRGTSAFPNYTPDLRDRYIRFTKNSGVSGLKGGIAVYNFDHSHGGTTETADFGGDDADTDDDYYTSHKAHHHTMSSFVGYPGGHSPLKDLHPPYYTVKWFMKIQ